MYRKLVVNGIKTVFLEPMCAILMYFYALHNALLLMAVL